MDVNSCTVLTVDFICFMNHKDLLLNWDTASYAVLMISCDECKVHLWPLCLYQS